MAASVRAGHPAYYEGVWRYMDGEPMSEPPKRPCPACGLEFKTCCVCMEEFGVATAHDPCMGHIADAASACCGHGGATEPHVLLRADEP